MIYSSRPGQVLRGDKWIDEKHLAASGEAPQVETVEPAPLVWQEVERAQGSGVDYRNCCIEARFDKRGKKYYRAVARIEDDEYPGERFKCSKEYRACDAADVQLIDASKHIDGHTKQQEERTRAAVARSHMDERTQAAMTDMRHVMAETFNDLIYPYKMWQVERDRLMARKREQAEARGVLRLALEALADEPDLVDMLKALVKDG